MNPILVDLGFVQIYWHSLMLFLGFLFGGWITLKEAKRFGIEEDFIINMFFYIVPISIIGARIYYVIFNWKLYSENIIDILKIWDGGLVFHGGFLLALIFAVIYTKKHSYSVLKILDICFVGLIIGQIIGSWGNFFDQKSYGSVIALEELKSYYLPNFIIEGMNINGIYYQPTFLYESVLCLLGFIIILFIRRIRHIKLGQISGFYLIWYGVGSYFIEAIRINSLMVGNIKITQLISVIMAFAGLLLFLANAFRGRFNNNYNEV